MPKGMKTRDVVAALVAAGCTLVRHGSNHDLWVCADGEHRTAVPRHREVTPGVVGAIIKQMPCLQKGWLQ